MARRSSSFYLKEKPKNTKKCDHEGCKEAGTHRAPKDRTLKEYYWFCEKHVKEYNESWNFYNGLSDDEVEKEIHSSYVWDRPTWKFGTYDSRKIFNKAANFFEFFLDMGGSNSGFENSPLPPQDIADALKTMNLKLPLDETSLKSRYKELAKTHHPDLNSGNKESEELFKRISVAYQILLKFLT